MLQARLAGQLASMTVLRAIARPMLASIFAIQGYETMRHPERVSGRAEPVVRPLAERIPAVPDKTEEAVRLNGSIQFMAGSMLAIGLLPRLSSLAIAATLVPTTIAGHRFWEAQDDQERAQQRIHFLKNLAIFGGLLIAAAATPPIQRGATWRSPRGRPSCPGRLAQGRQGSPATCLPGNPAHRRHRRYRRHRRARPRTSGGLAPNRTGAVGARPRTPRAAWR